jgi:hypothetical protein
MPSRSPRIVAALVRIAALLVAFLPGSLALGSPLRAEPAAQGGAAPTADVVGRLRVEAPKAEAFLLHGTLPLPQGAWTDPAGCEPFVVLDHDGTPVPTQCEVVSRYASPADGIDVAEVIARVHRPPGVAAGAALAYDVVYLPHPEAAPPAPSLAALFDGPLDVPPGVKTLLKSPYGFAIECIDPFGNSYLSLPFDGSGTMELQRHGPMAAEMRIASTLVPAPPVAGALGTLPHGLGVQVYVTASTQDDLIEIDLRFHNAHSGLDKSVALDDPLGKVYFREINLYVPNGWFLVQDFLDPFLALPTPTAGAWSRFPLVAKTPAGMHALKWQGQFHRRLVLGPASKIGAAHERARGAGLGFAARGFSPLTGKPLWSWWNPATARWFPQSHRLPSLAHVDPASLDSKLNIEAANLEAHLLNGSAGVTYPVVAQVLGHAHPYGVKYGGMTGGIDISIYDGIQTLERASLAGYRTALMTHRMNTDRMPNALFNGDGRPAKVEDWKIPLAGGKDYVPISYFGTPDIGATDPFGVLQAPGFQVQYVDSQGLAAPFTAELAEFAPYDFQHLVRYTRVAKMLVWLANDSLAKDDLMMQSEAFHFSYHQYFNSPYQGMQVSGLRNAIEGVATHGPVGFAFGRGEAWGLDCAVATYAIAPPAWRAANRPWLDLIAKVVFDGQSSCTGFIQAHVGKALDGKYRTRQQIEQSIIENSLRGMIETVYRGADPLITQLLTETYRKSLLSMLDPMAWAPGKNAPWSISAVGPSDLFLPPYCDISQVPVAGHSDYTDAYQNWSSFAYGFEATGDPTFLSFAQLQSGSADLVGALLVEGAKNVENRAALLALVQQAIGMP